MRIAVNTRLLIKGKLEGIGWFTYENLKRITKAHPEHQFFFLFDRDYHDDFIFNDNITPIILSPPARHPFLYYIWFQYSVPACLKKINADIFISTDGYMPLNLKIKSFTVFHDLNFEHYPKDVPLIERWYYRTFFPKFAWKADRIATVSEYSKNDLINLYGVTPNKVDVVYNGANEIFTPLEPDKKQKVRDHLTDGLPYFYFIGALHPRKNLVNLFKAYDIFREQNSQPVKLVITGARKWWTNEIERTYSNLKYKDDVIFTGRLDIQVARDVMGSALALTYVSYFEGFGIPLVEAFRSGTPVITSNVTSMPEVADDAALIVDPFNPEDIAKAMINISNNEELRKDLINKGFKRAEIFTWDASSEMLWNSIIKLL